VSGFVVEWFAVREKTSSILHWEKLNSSSTTLVITGNPTVSAVAQHAEKIMIILFFFFFLGKNKGILSLLCF